VYLVLPSSSHDDFMFLTVSKSSRWDLYFSLIAQNFPQQFPVVLPVLFVGPVTLRQVLFAWHVPLSHAKRLQPIPLYTVFQLPDLHTPFNVELLSWPPFTTQVEDAPFIHPHEPAVQQIPLLQLAELHSVELEHEAPLSLVTFVVLVGLVVFVELVMFVVLPGFVELVWFVTFCGFPFVCVIAFQTPSLHTPVNVVFPAWFPFATQDIPESSDQPHCPVLQQIPCVHELEAHSFEAVHVLPLSFRLGFVVFVGLVVFVELVMFVVFPGFVEFVWFVTLVVLVVVVLVVFTGTVVFVELVVLVVFVCGAVLEQILFTWQVPLSQA
jgi:hypothetical protein